MHYRGHTWTEVSYCWQTLTGGHSGEIALTDASLQTEELEPMFPLSCVSMQLCTPPEGVVQRKKNLRSRTNPTTFHIFDAL